MGVLNNANEAVWKAIFTFVEPVSDNVIIVLLFACTAVAAILFLIRRKMGRSKAAFFIPEFLFLTSSAFMIEDLPNIHSRLHTALSTVCSVLSQSQDYMTNFTATTGFTPMSVAELARCLYYDCNAESFLNTDPYMLYEKLYSTMSSIGVPWICQSGFYWVVVLVIVYQCVRKIQNKEEKGWLKFLIQSAFMIWMCTFHRGAVISAAYLWILESGLQEYSKRLKPRMHRYDSKVKRSTS